MQRLKGRSLPFKTESTSIRLVRPAIIGDGIEETDEKEQERLIRKYDEGKSGYHPLKFVPASGAASRMFKSLFEASVSLDHSPENQEKYLREHALVREFFEDLAEYPFYFDLKEKAKEKHLDLDLMMQEKKYHAILDLLLGPEGLNYGELPKGLLKFHSYGQLSRTAFEEHFAETFDYLSDEDDEINLHFTVSPAFRPHFEKLARQLSEEYSEKYGSHFIVCFSEQQPETDTIAVDLNNEPFRDKEGILLFRPGGHGALLDNLNQMESALVFIGNIDNVGHEETRVRKVRYKKILGGNLLDKVHRIHRFP